MIIPIGNNKEDLKSREAVITSFYVEWNHNNPEHRVFNNDLNDYIYVTYLSLDETRRHAAKRPQSTLAVLQLDTILRTAKRVGKPLPVSQVQGIRKISQKCLEWNANWKI